MDDSRRTVLIVDDDPDFLDQMELELAAAGFAVVRAEGEAAAEALLPTHRFDLAVVDLMMESPDSGFTLCHHIKRRDPQVPVILVTSVASETGITFHPASREDRSWVSADAVLDKPVRFEQLKREIRRLLRTVS